ncbi:unnamed protein product [Linum trigynum]|uniref:Uncharacterized protein n=1 Tax=Linum trigynum TaxID=586398 RepID=A0AAV2F6C4_9ROSI
MLLTMDDVKEKLHFSSTKKKKLTPFEWLLDRHHSHRLGEASPPRKTRKARHREPTQKTHHPFNNNNLNKNPRTRR